MKLALDQQQQQHLQGREDGEATRGGGVACDTDTGSAVPPALHPSPVCLRLPSVSLSLSRAPLYECLRSKRPPAFCPLFFARSFGSQLTQQPESTHSDDPSLWRLFALPANSTHNITSKEHGCRLRRQGTVTEGDEWKTTSHSERVRGRERGWCLSKIFFALLFPFAVCARKTCRLDSH